MPGGAVLTCWSCSAKLFVRPLHVTSHLSQGFCPECVDIGCLIELANIQQHTALIVLFWFMKRVPRGYAVATWMMLYIYQVFN